MTLLTLPAIRKRVKTLAKAINAPKELITISGCYKWDTEFIEIDECGYHYILTERGNEIRRRSTKNIEELLYWIFEEITFSMASDYELDNRKPNVDSRRLLFDKQLELMALIGHEFKIRLEKEFGLILKEVPFVDE
jgi:hypothetical protein